MDIELTCLLCLRNEIPASSLVGKWEDTGDSPLWKGEEGRMERKLAARHSAGYVMQSNGGVDPPSRVRDFSAEKLIPEVELGSVPGIVNNTFPMYLLYLPP